MGPASEKELFVLWNDFLLDFLLETYFLLEMYFLLELHFLLESYFPLEMLL